MFQWQDVSKEAPAVSWEVKELPNHQEEAKVTTLVEKTRSRIDQKEMPSKEQLINWFDPNYYDDPEVKKMVFLEPTYPKTDPEFYDDILSLMDKMLQKIQTKDLSEYLFETGVFVTPLDNPDLLKANRLSDEVLEGMPSYVDH